MPRCSNAVICFANFLTILIAIPLICTGLWMKSQTGTECQRSIPMLLLFTGAALLFLSLCGIFGSCCRLNFFMWIYLFFLFLLIVIVMISMSFSFVITGRKVGDTMSDFKLETSMSWVQKWATKNWEATEQCMKKAKLCDTKMMKFLDKNNDTVGNLFSGTEIYEHISPVQNGCCRPPTDCGFTFVNATYWEAPKKGNTTSANGDCKLWSNDAKCYACESCKAGMGKIGKLNLKINAWLSMVVLICLIIIYSIGCCAFQNNRVHRYQRYY